VEPVKLLSDLVSIRSLTTTKEGYEEAADFLKEVLEEAGLEVKIYDGKEVVEDGLPRPNVVAFMDFGAEKTLMLNAHYDVVPPGEGWSYDPFKPIIMGGELHGRGSSDDKSGIVAAIWAANELGEGAKRNIMLAFTCDEEVGGRAGLGYLMNEVGLKPDEALIIDGGHEAIYVGASGVIFGKIATKGIQGHAGYPHKAKNPIYPLARAIVAMQEFVRFRESKLSKFRSPPNSPIPYVWGRFSVTVVKAGEKSNVIPGEAEASFDLRLLPEEDMENALSELRDFLARISEEIGWEVELREFEGGGNYYTEPDDPFVRGFSNATEKVLGEKLEYAAELGANDGRYVRGKGIPTLVFGPIAPDNRFHGVDEFVRIADIEMVKDVIVNYVMEEAL